MERAGGQAGGGPYRTYLGGGPLTSGGGGGGGGQTNCTVPPVQWIHGDRQQPKTEWPHDQATQ